MLSRLFEPTLLSTGVHSRLPLPVGRHDALPLNSPRRALLRMTQGSNPHGLDDDQCYLFDTREGHRYVCTEDPAQLAWYMGLEMEELKAGPKPDDLELIECSEEWSHTGTPQWVCKEGKEGKEEAKGEEAQGEECTIIGESSDEIWFSCNEGAAPQSSDVACTEEDFGVGGGPGILPQDGEKLCVQKKPMKAASA